MTTDNAGKKSYVKSKVLKGSVQIGALTVDQVRSSLSSAISWSSNQTATLWVFDKTVGEDVMIEHDNQFQNLFEMYKQEMLCRLHLIVVDKTVFQQPCLPQVDTTALQPYTELQSEPLVVLPPDIDAKIPADPLVPTVPEAKLSDAEPNPSEPKSSKPEPESDPTQPTESEAKSSDAEPTSSYRAH